MLNLPSQCNFFRICVDMRVLVDSLTIASKEGAHAQTKKQRQKGDPSARGGARSHRVLSFCGRTTELAPADRLSSISIDPGFVNGWGLVPTACHFTSRDQLVCGFWRNVRSSGFAGIGGDRHHYSASDS